MQHDDPRLYWNWNEDLSVDWILEAYTEDTEPRGLVVGRCAYGSRGPEFEFRLTQHKDHR